MARKAKTTAPKSPYDVHPSVLMMQNWITTLKEKTGRSLEEWVRHIKKDGPPDDKGRRQWLKDQYQLGTNTAWWLAERVANKAEWWDSDPEGYLQIAVKYVEDMYA